MHAFLPPASPVNNSPGADNPRTPTTCPECSGSLHLSSPPLRGPGWFSLSREYSVPLCPTLHPRTHSRWIPGIPSGRQYQGCVFPSLARSGGILGRWTAVTSRTELCLIPFLTPQSGPLNLSLSPVYIHIYLKRFTISALVTRQINNISPLVQ